MSLPVFDLEVLTDTVLFLSAGIGFFLASLMAWKTWKNHLRYHVFRPMLAGFSAFLFESSVINIYLLAHWKDLTPHGYEAHLWIAILILCGYLALLTTVLYSAKHVFQQMDTAIVIKEEEMFKRNEEEDE